MLNARLAPENDSDSSLLGGWYGSNLRQFGRITIPVKDRHDCNPGILCREKSEQK
jgi:hypothetical protein